MHIIEEGTEYTNDPYTHTKSQWEFSVQEKTEIQNTDNCPICLCTDRYIHIDIRKCFTNSMSQII